MIESAEALKKQWEHTRHIPQGFTRIDTESLLDWRIGYDEDLCHTLLVVSKTSGLLASESTAVEIRRGGKKGQNKLYLVLQEGSQADVFMTMCYDLLVYSQSAADEAEAFRRFQYRYLQWDKLFQRLVSGGLTEAQQRGLIGELLFLLSMADQMPLLEAVEGWHGPDASHQDFLYQAVWYEVKAIREAAVEVRISSLEQLDGPSEGRLVLERLRDMAVGAPGSFTLNQLVETVCQRFAEDAAALQCLEGRLLSAGYHAAPRYSVKGYAEQERVIYEVRADFPRIIPRMVHGAVTKASYQLSIPALEAWKYKRS